MFGLLSVVGIGVCLWLRYFLHHDPFPPVHLHNHRLDYRHCLDER